MLETFVDVWLKYLFYRVDIINRMWIRKKVIVCMGGFVFLVEIFFRSIYYWS